MKHKLLSRSVAALLFLLVAISGTVLYSPFTVRASYPDSDFTQFDALTAVDSMGDLSKLKSVKYTKGLAVREGGANESMFKNNDNTLWLDPLDL